MTTIDLTIDENDDPDSIATHADNNGFGWQFGVVLAELRNSLVDPSVAPSSCSLGRAPGRAIGLTSCVR